MDNEILFRGVGTALVTPMTATGQVDTEAFQRLVRAQLDAKIDALVVCGTTGEASTLREGERDALLAAALEEAGGRVPVVMGVGANDTYPATENARRAAAVGADAMLAVTPYYNKGTREGIRRHFLAVAEAGGKPLIVYNVPSRTGVDLSAADYAALAAHPLVAGVKEASADMEKTADICRRFAGRLRIYTGCDTLSLPAFAAGADGWISVVSNLLPRESTAIFRDFAAGEIKTAAAGYRKLFPLMRALFAEVNPAPIKYAMAKRGYGENCLRLPLSAVTAETAEKLDRETRIFFA